MQDGGSGWGGGGGGPKGGAQGRRGGYTAEQQISRNADGTYTFNGDIPDADINEDPVIKEAGEDVSVKIGLRKNGTVLAREGGLYDHDTNFANLDVYEADATSKLEAYRDSHQAEANSLRNGVLSQSQGKEYARRIRSSKDPETTSKAIGQEIANLAATAEIKAQSADYAIQALKRSVAAAKKR